MTLPNPELLTPWLEVRLARQARQVAYSVNPEGAVAKQEGAVAKEQLMQQMRGALRLPQRIKAPLLSAFRARTKCYHHSAPAVFELPYRTSSLGGRMSMTCTDWTHSLFRA